MACRAICEVATTLDILERLIAFPTLSRTSNRPLISYVTGLLDSAGIGWSLIESPDGTRTNLFATVGPQDRPGVVLSGHTDVVPVEGQNWTTDPFHLRHAEGRYYGRGTADMKGFVASAISAALFAAKRPLVAPLHLALSYDEEIGCIGVRGLLDWLQHHGPKAAVCIVGEPTGMKIATGHKGKTALRASCTGHACHSALAPEGLNALHLGADFLTCLRQHQARIVANGPREEGYDVPYTTLHAGLMSGGRALNIVPDHCDIDFEIRNIAADDPAGIVEALRADAQAIAAPYRKRFPEAAIEITQENAYPGLQAGEDMDIVALLRDITGSNDALIKAAFGTEGGLFQSVLGMPVAVCGPGDMAQGHKPDEFITAQQLARCDAMMARLIGRLETGL